MQVLLFKRNRQNGSGFASCILPELRRIIIVSGKNCFQFCTILHSSTWQMIRFIDCTHAWQHFTLLQWINIRRGKASFMTSVLFILPFLLQNMHSLTEIMVARGICKFACNLCQYRKQSSENCRLHRRKVRKSFKSMTCSIMMLTTSNGNIYHEEYKNTRKNLTWQLLCIQ